MDDEAIATAEDFFRRVVEPNFWDFETHRDMRRAMNLAVSAIALRDWVAKQNQRKVSEYHEQLVQIEPLFQHCRDVAIAAKHFELKNPNVLVDARDVASTALACGDPCGSALREIAIVTTSQRTLFRDVAWAVISMWYRELKLEPAKRP
jgi:hypothetical protein